MHKEVRLTDVKNQSICTGNATLRVAQVVFMAQLGELRYQYILNGCKKINQKSKTKMSYKQIETLCLSSEVTYKQAKEVIEPIFEEWWDKRLKDQVVDAAELLDVLLAIAKNKSRISNYTLDKFLKVIADWGHMIYWPNKNWETSKFEAFKAKIIDFALTMLTTIKRSKTKTSDTLRAYLLRLLANMLRMELRPEFLPILEDSMMVMNTEEQFFALEGLKNYVFWESTKSNKELISKLNEIVEKTTVRSNASNALDVLIIAGVIKQSSAVFAMDHWKDRNRNNW